jgi:hypothetical protein
MEGLELRLGDGLLWSRPAQFLFRIRKRGGRKLVVTLDVVEWASRPRADNATLKASARAFRWRKLMDTGAHPTLEDLASHGSHSYVSRVLRSTLLAPEIVEGVLDGRQAPELELDDLLDDFPLDGTRSVDAREKMGLWSRCLSQIIQPARPSQLVARRPYRVHFHAP